ncbi:MAG: DsbA family protein [Pseudomonadota bacterium]
MRPILAATAIALTASTALADGLLDMSDAERDTFRAEVRQYLLENPEVLMEAIGVLEARQAEAEAMRDERAVALNKDALLNDGHSYVGGNPDGDITIVEFIDYRCGFCRRAHPEVAELIETDGNIRIITKEYPVLGEQSVLASRFAVATKTIAGDEAYAEISNALIALRSDVTEDSLRALGEAYDLPTDAIVEEMMSEATTTILQENRALGDRMAITGTPTFVFGDRMVRGYVQLPEMRRIVDQLREES